MISLSNQRPWGACLMALTLTMATAASCSKQEPAASPETNNSADSAVPDVPPLETSKESTTTPDAATISGLVSTAETAHGQEQYVAIDDLGEHHQDAEQVVPVLEKLLASEDEQVRWRSARALSDYESEAAPAAPELVKLLDDSNPVVQYHAAVALGRIGDKSDATIRALVEAVGSDDPRVARAAIGAIRTLEPDPPHVLAALETALNSEDHALVLNAMKAIADHGPDAVPLLNEALKKPETALIACSIIEHVGPEAAGTVPALTDLLNESEHSQLEIEALLALARIGPAAQSATPQIVPLLKHQNDATVPVAAAFALGSIDAEDADDELRAAVESDDEFLQMVAAWSLAKIHPDDADLKQQALDKLQSGLKSDDPAIKAAAEKGMKHLEATTAATPTS